MRLHARISLMRAPLMSEAGRVQVGIKEVRAIVDAIERRDSEEVFVAATYHVRQAAALALAHLRREESRADQARKKQDDEVAARSENSVVRISAMTETAETNKGRVTTCTHGMVELLPSRCC